MLSTLKGNGRIWIYSADRALSAPEAVEIKKRLASFCNDWSAHGSRLAADFNIVYNQIMMLGVDEEVAEATGCSIDKATDIFKQIDEEFQLDLFNRMNLFFVQNERLRLVKLADINQAYRSGLVREDTIFLDNSISTRSHLDERWQLPFKDSWMFKKVKLPASR